jgi:hypothetical protein
MTSLRTFVLALGLAAGAGLVGGPACSSSSVVPSTELPSSGVVGAAGGTVSSSDGRVRLSVPPGAVSGETTITIAPARSDVPGAVGQVWEIAPTGLVFARPVRVELAYRDADLGGRPVTLFAVSTEVGATWGPLANPTRDTASRVMSGDTLHLSLFAVASSCEGKECNSDGGALDGDEGGSVMPPPPEGDGGTDPCTKYLSDLAAVRATGYACKEAGLVCTATNVNGLLYAYCDGAHFELFTRPPTCPATPPAGATCPNNPPECTYNSPEGPDCFTTCNCYYAIGWVCMNRCACAPVPSDPFADTQAISVCTPIPACGNDSRCNGTYPATLQTIDSTCAATVAGKVCSWVEGCDAASRTRTYKCLPNGSVYGNAFSWQAQY